MSARSTLEILAPLRRFGSTALTTLLFACSAATTTEAPTEATAEQGLRSGHAACPGYGWTDGITSWATVRGTYERRGAAVAGELGGLVIDEDPGPQNDSRPKYDRQLDGASDTGKLMLGVDNPAIGPVLGFSESSRGAKDLYWVLGQKRNRKQEIVGLCLAQASTVDGVNASRPTTFMLERKP